MPARQALLIEMVGKEDLMNAIALNSSIFNTARAMGPALAGLLIAALGTAACFFINSLSFLAVLGGLLRMTVTPAQHRELPSYNLLRDMREALASIRATPPVWTTILLVAVISIFGTNFNVLVPVFARMELLRDATAFGFLLSSFGAGAMIGALTLTILSRSGPKPMFLFGSGLCLSVFLILIGMQKSYAITAFLLACSGWSMVTFFGMANTTIQLNTEDRLRGRVLSIYTLAFGGLTPFGSLFAGTLSYWIKAPATFALGGTICGIAFLAILLLRRNSRVS